MATAEPLFDRSAVNFVGPFEHYDVVVRGRRVPFLAAQMLPGGRIRLSLDNRLALDLAMEEAERFLPFLADSIAVALGYTCHPEPEWDDPVRRPPFVQMMPLGPDGSS